MNAQETQHRADQVLASVGELPATDALLVLNAAMEKVIAEIGRGTPDFQAPALPGTDLLLRRRQRARIALDDEVRAFLHAQPMYLTIAKLEAACRQRFGNRAPSKSAIHRYIQGLKLPNSKKLA